MSVLVVLRSPRHSFCLKRSARSSVTDSPLVMPVHSSQPNVAFGIHTDLTRFEDVMGFSPLWCTPALITIIAVDFSLELAFSVLSRLIKLESRVSPTCLVRLTVGKALPYSSK